MSKLHVVLTLQCCAATLLPYHAALASGAVLFEDDFLTAAGPFTPGLSDCADAPIPTGLNDWYVANDRVDFLSDPGEAEFVGGVARVWDLTNSAVGGYFDLYREIPEEPADWTITVEFLIDTANFASRPVPQVLTQRTSGCNGVPKRGFEVSSDQHVYIRDPLAVHDSGFFVTTGSWYTAELRSDPLSSEIRVWPAGGVRPSAPQAVGGSLGDLHGLFFTGPNYQDFDYSIDYVRVEDNAVSDADGDGIPDVKDTCPLDPDNDADGDGVCGDLDVCPGGDDGLDDDSDTVPDACDVCPGWDDHSDADADAIPDDCEVCGVSVGGTEVSVGTDADSDGLGDGAEALFVGTSPADDDTDGDALSDGAETCTWSTDPLASDTDGDLLADGMEVSLGTDPLRWDTDGDRASDGYEILAGTDALDPSDSPLVRIPWTPTPAERGSNRFIAR